MSTPTILVTSAAGHTGLPTVTQLLERGFAVRALVHRDDARSERLRRLGAQIVVGSLDDPVDLARATDGVRRAYFAAPFAPGALRVSSAFAEAAEEARLEVLVVLSQWLAHPSHPSVHTREIWLADRRFAALPNTGVVTVNPGWFADNYMAGLEIAAQLGLLAMPLGEGLNAPPSNEDIARVVVGALVDPAPHIGATYRPTGPAFLAPDEIAATFGRVLGRRVRYQDASPTLFSKVSRALGYPDYVTTSVLTYFEDYRRGAFAIGAPTDAVAHVGGRAPEDFETIVRRYVEAAPSARRTIGSRLRAIGALSRVMMTPAVDVARVGRTYGAGDRDRRSLAADSAGWLATHDAMAGHAEQGPIPDDPGLHPAVRSLSRAS